MAIRKRVSADGKRRSYTVTWREDGARDGKQRGVTVNREHEANRIQAAIIANGHRLPDEYAHLLRGAAWRQRVDKPTPVPAPEATSGPLTFGEYALRHVDNLTGVGEGYCAEYRRSLARHALPVFGAVPLAAITEDDARTWLRGFEAGTHPWLNGRPLARQTRKRLLMEVGAVTRRAHRRGLVPADPFAEVKIGKQISTGEMARNRERGREQAATFLTHEEWARLRDELRAGLPRDLATLLVSTGLRWSEATALDCRHVILDDSRPRIVVEQAWKRNMDSTTYSLGEPKSTNSKRTVSLAPGVAEMLAGYVVGKRPRDLVFATRRGTRLANNNFRTRHWEPAVGRFAGDRYEGGKLVERGHGKRPRIHDLRHTHASWLIEAKLSLTAIQRRLGHESIQLTSDTYGHLMPGADDAAATAIEGAPGFTVADGQPEEGEAA